MSMTIRQKLQNFVNEGLIRIALISLMVVVSLYILSVYALFYGRAPLELLSISYLFYAITTIIVLHTAFFAWDYHRFSSGRGHLSKNVPKYLDYAYTGIVGLSLLQIFAFGPKAAEYIVWLHGDEAHISNQIKDVAARHLADDCPNKSTKTIRRWFRYDTAYHFTLTYCAKLQRIVDAPDLLKHIVTTVIPDRSFVHHTTEESLDPEIGRAWGSPIEDLVARLEIVQDYRRAKGHEDDRGTIAWVGLLIFPIGLAFRIIKTSLELFVPLQ